AALVRPPSHVPRLRSPRRGALVGSAPPPPSLGGAVLLFAASPSSSQGRSGRSSPGGRPLVSLVCMSIHTDDIEVEPGRAHRSGGVHETNPCRAGTGERPGADRLLRAGRGERGIRIGAPG